MLTYTLLFLGLPLVSFATTGGRIRNIPTVYAINFIPYAIITLNIANWNWDAWNAQGVIYITLIGYTLAFLIGAFMFMADFSLFLLYIVLHAVMGNTGSTQQTYLLAYAYLIAVWVLGSLWYGRIKNEYMCVWRNQVVMSIGLFLVLVAILYIQIGKLLY